MSGAIAVANVIEAFEQQGFAFVGKTDDGWFRLHGQLIPPHWARAIRARFSSIRRSSTYLASGCWKSLRTASCGSSSWRRWRALLSRQGHGRPGHLRSCRTVAGMPATRGRLVRADPEGEMIEDPRKSSSPTGTVGFASWTCKARIWGGRTASSRRPMGIPCGSSPTTKIEQQKTEVARLPSHR